MYPGSSPPWQQHEDAGSPNTNIVIRSLAAALLHHNTNLYACPPFHPQQEHEDSGNHYKYSQYISQMYVIVITNHSACPPAQEHEDAGNPNECHLVWQGSVKEPAFKAFSTQVGQGAGQVWLCLIVAAAGAGAGAAAASATMPCCL